MRTRPSAVLAATVALGSAWVVQLSAQVIPAAFTLTSSAFADGGQIPKEHANDSRVFMKANVSPPLSWSGAPPSTAEFAVIAEGDATMSTSGRPPIFWVVYGIPGSATGLPKGMEPGNVVFGPLAGTIQGLSTLDRFAGSTGSTGRRVADSKTAAEYTRPGITGAGPGLGISYETAERLHVHRPIVTWGWLQSSPSKPRYHGPAPTPGKTQTYTFTVYAIDAGLNLPDGLTGEQVRAAIDGHVVAKDQLTGIYNR